jgi:SAM-dependent methyltransferase
MSTDASEVTPEVTPFDDGDLYDVWLGDVPYGLDFYVGLARAARGPVLDVCCGTGRIMLPCLEAGVDIEGVDLHAPMLERLRAKARQRGFAPNLHQSDMGSFRLDRRYALVMIPGNAFVHNLTTAAQIQTLRCCHDHLLPGGLLALDAYFPALSLIGAPNGQRVLEGEMQHPTSGLTVRAWDTRTFDRVEQIQHSLNEVEEIDTEGRVVATHRSTTSVRWIYKGEMELLVRVAGFARWHIAADFDGRELTQETDGMVVRAWRA